MTQQNNTKFLLTGFAIILLGMLGLIAVFFFHINTMMKSDQINDDLLKKNFAAYQMREAAEKRTFSLFRVIALDDYFERDQIRLNMDRYALDFMVAQSQLDLDALSPAEKEALDDILVRVSEARPVVDKAMALAVEEQWSPAVQDLIEASLQKFDFVHQALNVFVVTVEAETARQRAELQALRQREVELIPVLGVFLFVASLGIGIFVVRREIAHTYLLEQRYKQSSEELGVREMHYRTIVETAADGIITTDDKGYIESFNPASERIFGYTTSEVAGRSVNMLMPSHDANRHDHYIANYLGGGAPKIIGVGRELVGVRRSGEEFPMWLAISRMQVGDETKFVGVVSDLSAQKKAEGEARLLADDNEIVASILRLSLTSEDLDHILQMALELILGRENLDLQGKGSVFLSNPKTNKLVMRAQCNLADALIDTCAEVPMGACLCGQAAESMTEVEKSCLDHDHTVRMDDMSDHGHFCVPINYANQNLGVLNLYIPHGHKVTVHERRLIWAVADTLAGVVHRNNKEVELRVARDRAETANRTKSDFLANMSHELRTPLNAIIGYSQMMSEEVFGPVGSEKYKEYLDHISASGHHLYGLINDILDISRIETDGFPLAEEEVNTTSLIEECMGVVRTKAQDAGNTVTFLNADPLPSLYVDRRRLKQVLLNLLQNAIKFTERGGTIRIRVEASATFGVIILVSDDGIGIAESDLEKVFDMFGQVDSSLARKYDGAGLGLPLSRKLIEKHGGQLTLESTPGVGTTAAVSLPNERVIWN